ncbi:MAG: LamG domain-containing protein [bacterium]
MQAKIKVFVILTVVITSLFIMLPVFATEQNFKPAIGNVDNVLSGLEKVVSALTGGIEVYNQAGRLLDNFPLFVNGVVASSPVLADITGDLQKEIVFVGRNKLTGYSLYAYDGNKNLIAVSSLGTSTVYYDPIILPTSGKDEILLATVQGSVQQFAYNGGSWQKKEIYNAKELVGLSANYIGNKIVINYPNKSLLNILAKSGSNWGLKYSIAVPDPIIYPVLYGSENIYGIDNKGRLAAFKNTTMKPTGGNFPIVFDQTPVDSPYWAEIDTNNPGYELVVALSSGVLTVLDKDGMILKKQYFKNKSFLKNMYGFFDEWNNSIFMSIGNGKGMIILPNSRSIASILSRRQLSPTVATPINVANTELASSTNRIRISWNSYIDIYGSWDHFDIYRSQSPSAQFNSSTLMTQLSNLSLVYYDDYSVQSNVDYYYSIRAVNKDQKSSSNNWVGPMSVDLSGAPPAATGTPPILYLNLDEPALSASIVDSSGEGNNGTCIGINCPIFGEVGKSNNAVFFDGKDDYIEIADSVSLNPTSAVTVEAWIKPEMIASSSFHQIIVSKKYNYGLSITNDGRLRATIINSNNSKSSISSAPGLVLNNNWNYIVMSYDGVHVKAYLNGTQIGSQPQVGDIRTNNYALTIGQAEEKYYYQGQMDEVKIYNRALSESEIIANYSLTLNDLLLHFSFDELPSSTVFVDLAGNGNNSICKGKACPLSGLAGLVNNAISLDGIDDYVSALDSISLSPQSAISVEAWVKPTLATTSLSNQVIVSKNLAYELTITRDGHLKGGIKNSLNVRKSVLAKHVVNSNIWNHLVMTYDGANIRVYANGLLVGTQAQTGLIQDNVFDLTIGKHGIGYYFDGLIDELKVYRRTLSDSEILSNYSGS